MSDESKYTIIPGEQTPVELMKEFPSCSVTMVGLRHNREPAARALPNRVWQRQLFASAYL